MPIVFVVYFACKQEPCLHSHTESQLSKAQITAPAAPCKRGSFPSTAQAACSCLPPSWLLAASYVEAWAEAVKSGPASVAQEKKKWLGPVNFAHDLGPSSHTLSRARQTR